MITPISNSGYHDAPLGIRGETAPVKASTQPDQSGLFPGECRT